MQARLFSYIDTQLTRLAGPNFNQIPINRPHAPVNDMFRDGYHQHAVHGGAAPYKPNSLDGGNPFLATEEERAFVESPVTVAEGQKVRGAPASYDDHFSQVRLFWQSMTPVEKTHIIDAYTFELGKCYEQAIKERQLQALAEVDAELCGAVAAGLGLPAPAPTTPPADVQPSPALSQVGKAYPPDGRMIGIVVDVASGDGLAGVAELRTALMAAGTVPLLIANHGGELGDGLVAQRTYATARSVEYDAVLVAGAPTPPGSTGGGPEANPTPATVDGRVVLLLQEAFRHGKAVAAWGAGTTALEAAGIPGDVPGVYVTGGATAALDDVMAALGKHRAWERFVPAAS
jgi:catalase